MERLELQHAVGHRLRECTAETAGYSRGASDHDTFIERGMLSDDDFCLAQHAIRPGSTCALHGVARGVPVHTGVKAGPWSITHAGRGIDGGVGVYGLQVVEHADPVAVDARDP